MQEAVFESRAEEILWYLSPSEHQRLAWDPNGRSLQIPRHVRLHSTKRNVSTTKVHAVACQRYAVASIRFDKVCTPNDGCVPG